MIDVDRAARFYGYCSYYSVAMYPSNRRSYGCGPALCSVGAGKKCCYQLLTINKNES